ncbi:hypothetical protein BH23BAC1_BH23BAC1_43470 [soil metagenome]
MDTYYRTFPNSTESYTNDNLPVISKYGLTVIPTGSNKDDKIDEMHVLTSNEIKFLNENVDIIHHVNKHQYIFENLFGKIKEEYGQQFEGVVKVLLDYN